MRKGTNLKAHTDTRLWTLRAIEIIYRCSHIHQRIALSTVMMVVYLQFWFTAYFTQFTSAHSCCTRFCRLVIFQCLCQMYMRLVVPALTCVCTHNCGISCARIQRVNACLMRSVCTLSCQPHDNLVNDRKTNDPRNGAPNIQAEAATTCVSNILIRTCSTCELINYNKK